MVCKHCHKTISLPWRNYSHVGLLGVFLAMLAMAALKKEALGIDSYLLYGLVLWLVVVVPVTFVMYWVFPLRYTPNRTDKSDDL